MTAAEPRVPWCGGNIAIAKKSCQNEGYRQRNISARKRIAFKSLGNEAYRQRNVLITNIYQQQNISPTKHIKKRIDNKTYQ